MIEKFSEEIHNIWMLWAGQILEQEPNLSSERASRWGKLFVPYKDLTEEEKDKDRVLAKRLIESLDAEHNTNDPYFSNQKAIDRLVEVYNTHGNIIVGFDFDDTIYDFHKKGFTYSNIINILKECNDLGFTLILHTCKYEEEHASCIEECIRLGISISYINTGPVFSHAKKPFFNICLDDKAGLSQAYYILKSAIEIIKKQGEEK